MDFIPFRHYIREPHQPHIKFEIFALTKDKFQVRLPEYDYIKISPGPCVEYDRNQLLCFLLAYDKTECFCFMEKLYHIMGYSQEEMQRRLYENPIFTELGGNGS